MEYGNVGAGTVLPATGILPFTVDNPVLFAIAVSLIALGVAVMVISAIIARKNRVSE